MSTLKKAFPLLLASCLLLCLTACFSAKETFARDGGVYAPESLLSVLFLPEQDALAALGLTDAPVKEPNPNRSFSPIDPAYPYFSQGYHLFGKEYHAAFLTDEFFYQGYAAFEYRERGNPINGVVYTCKIENAAKQDAEYVKTLYEGLCKIYGEPQPLPGDSVGDLNTEEAAKLPTYLPPNSNDDPWYNENLHGYFETWYPLDYQDDYLSLTAHVTYSVGKDSTTMTIELCFRVSPLLFGVEEGLMKDIGEGLDSEDELVYDAWFEKKCDLPISPEDELYRGEHISIYRSELDAALKKAWDDVDLTTEAQRLERALDWVTWRKIVFCRSEELGITLQDEDFKRRAEERKAINDADTNGSAFMQLMLLDSGIATEEEYWEWLPTDPEFQADMQEAALVDYLEKEFHKSSHSEELWEYLEQYEEDAIAAEQLVKLR